MSTKEICSECFKDEGLKRTASSFGIGHTGKCSNCGNYHGYALEKAQAESVLVEFFWNGSWFRADFGGAHRIVSNSYRYKDSDVTFAPWLAEDARLLQEYLHVGLFHYGPPLWRIGEVSPLHELRDTKTRSAAASEIVEHFPSTSLPAGSRLYRIRKNLPTVQEQQPSQYDAAPRNIKRYGRLDSSKLPVLYASESIDICFHECRITIPDECFVASMVTQKTFRLLDLTAEISEDTSPFDSKSVALGALFTGGEHTYPFTRAIAKAAKEAGYDGLIYPSYFSIVSRDAVANVGIFGFPIKAGDLSVVNINRAALKQVSYEVRYGPIFS